MKRLIVIGLIALVLTSCVIQVGHGYYDEDLSYYNEAMLYQVCDLGQLEVSVSGAEIELWKYYANGLGCIEKRKLIDERIA